MGGKGVGGGGGGKKPVTYSFTSLFFLGWDYTVCNFYLRGTVASQLVCSTSD